MTVNEQLGQSKKTKPMSVSLELDVFSRDSPIIPVCAPASRWPKMLAVISGNLPTHADGFGERKLVQVNLLILGALDNGFAKSSMTQVNGKTVLGEDSKNLCDYGKKIGPDGKETVDKDMLQCYAFFQKKGKPFDKGPRIDGTNVQINGGVPVTYALKPGMVIRLWVKRTDVRGSSGKTERENFLPSDVDMIRAGERVVVTFACKVRGFGITCWCLSKNCSRLY